MSDAVDLLRSLIRVDTSNPPGRETPAAVLIRDYLQANGVDAELVARGEHPERASVIGRLRGGSGPTLAFMGHLDVVPASRDGWDVDPFAAELRDGEIWGRGAVDMKCWIAAACAALARIARDGSRPSGDILFLGSVDEEQGKAGVGMPWLVEEHAELVRADYAVNEGAGERFEVGGRAFYTMSAGDKASTTATVTFGGRPGDPSSRVADENALADLASAVVALGEREPAPRVQQEAQRMLHLLGTPDVRAAAQLHPYLELLLPPVVTTTLTPVRASADTEPNVVAQEACLLVACRALPGDTKHDVERELRAALDGTVVEVELEDVNGGERSPLDTPLQSAIQSFLDAADPGAKLLPTLCTGYTCASVLRDAFGTVAYGFLPFRHQNPLTSVETKHGHNERIRVDDLEFQVAAAEAIARGLDG